MKINTITCKLKDFKAFVSTIDDIDVLRMIRDSSKKFSRRYYYVDNLIDNLIDK